ncbi:MAG: IS3 family transposase [Nitrospinae bacterium]|nr:IS3 family transposase [Nitrospinota bacterium]
MNIIIFGGAPYKKSEVRNGIVSKHKKVELIHGKTYNTHQEAKTAIFEYIEGFYNQQRRHSYLGRLSPDENEKMNAA